MDSLSRDHYPPVPTWREERDSLVKEVHGDSMEMTELDFPKNKVSSREKYVTKKLVTCQQFDDQKFHDFLLSCEQGLNTISFSYNIDTSHWKFALENFYWDRKENNNLSKNLNLYDLDAAALLTNIWNIKRYLTLFQGNFGRCIAILADEINKFITFDLKKQLKEIHEKPNAIKSTMQSIYSTLNGPIRSIESFLEKVRSLNSIGGHLLNLIKEERDSLPKCCQNLFHAILDRAYTRGMNFYMGILTDWLNDNNLENDMFFEFFIWDAAKRRYSRSVAQSDSILESDELVFLESVKPLKFPSPIDVKTFKSRYLVIPELFPVEFGEELIHEIVKIGIYNHVLMSENCGAFEMESKSAVIEQMSFESLSCLSSVIKSQKRRVGRDVLSHLCNQLEFSILIEKLPIYFCGIKNSVFDQFVELTENFNWNKISTHKNGKLHQLNRFYKLALEMSQLSNDPLSSMISLVFSINGQVDSSHPPTVNQAFYDRPLTDLEPEIHCKDSFRLAFPPTIFEPYRNLFRLRHTLRRALYLLKKKHFENRKGLSRSESNALSLMIRFVQNYDSFVFGYKAPKFVHEYLELINAGIHKKTLDLDTFLKEQELMIGKLHLTAFVSTIGDNFTNPMWNILNRMMKYATNQNDFTTTCIEVCRTLEKIKQYLRSKTGYGERLPELAEWIFGTNIQPIRGSKDGIHLCEELTKRFLVESSL